MAKIEYKVCVLTLTYANRWHFLEKVLTRLLEFGEITDIIIVNNASGYDVEERAKNLSSKKITVLNNHENLGSAGGYKQAIKYASENSEADFLWLLDDDNMPDSFALHRLLVEWVRIGAENDQKALFCLREDRIAHIRIAKGENPARYYLVPDNFMGFNIFNVVKNQYYKLSDKISKTEGNFKERVSIPYVPYGGLLIHRAILAKIGLPDERFYLYADDSEYTYRITQNGGTIWLIPACRVIDLDKSQGLEYKKKLFHSKLLDQWSFRTYYAVRNRMYFYSKVAIRRMAVFKINKALYLSYLQVVSLLSSKRKEYKKFLVAVNDGLKGKLGKANPEKF